MQMRTFDASAFAVPCDSVKNRSENLLQKFSFLFPRCKNGSGIYRNSCRASNRFAINLHAC